MRLHEVDFGVNVAQSAAAIAVGAMHLVAGEVASGDLRRVVLIRNDLDLWFIASTATIDAFEEMTERQLAGRCHARVTASDLTMDVNSLDVHPRPGVHDSAQCVAKDLELQTQRY